MRNQVRLIGKLGANPEVKAFEGGKKMAKISLATNESYKNAQGEKVTETQWHNLVAWGKSVEIIEKYLKKGSEIAVDGKLSTRNWTDKEGVKHYITEIIVNDFVFVGAKAQ